MASGEGNGRVRPGAEGLLAAAAQAFYEVGYGGTTVRTIAARANVTVAALYHHFSSKNEILTTLMRQVMETVLREAERALAQAAPTPAEQFAALVAAHVRYHTVHKVGAFVSNSELRSLEPPGRQEITGMRDRYEGLFAGTIERGVDEGVFQVDDPRQAARAVLAMCSGVSAWFRPGGPLTAEQVQQEHVALALNTVRYAPDGPARLGAGRVATAATRSSAPASASAS